MTKAEVFVEFIKVLEAIEKGEINISYVYQRTDLDEHFSTNNGWKFSFFDDNCDFDYLTSITAPDGTHCSYRDINMWDDNLADNQDENRIYLMNYQPPRKVWDSIYQPKLTEASAEWRKRNDISR